MLRDTRKKPIESRDRGAIRFALAPGTHESHALKRFYNEAMSRLYHTR